MRCAKQGPVLLGCQPPAGEWKPVQPLLPMEGAEVTDIALSFRWLHEMRPDRDLLEEEVQRRVFLLQVDGAPTFSSPEISLQHRGPKSTYRDSRPAFSRWTQLSDMSPNMLPPEEHHWRMKRTGNRWSEAMSFQLNDIHTHPPVIDISPASPLFSFDMSFDSGNEHPALQRYIFPFIEAVVERSLIPSRAEVLETVQIAVATPDVESQKGSGMGYGIHAPLFLATIGIGGCQSIASAEDEDADYYEMSPTPAAESCFTTRAGTACRPPSPSPSNSFRTTR